MAIGMLISAAAIAGLTTIESLCAYTPIFAVYGIGLGLGWALANVATQAVVPPSLAGPASGITLRSTLTSLVLLGAVVVAIAASVLDLLSGSHRRRARVAR